VANTAIDDRQQLTIAKGVAEELDATGATTVVTACPLCKRAIARGSAKKVVDLSEIVAGNLR
jgi:Fe-S oxidoreductase